MHLGRLATFSTCVIAFVSLTLACAGNYWIEQYNDNTVVSIGLWNTCLTKSGTTSCHSFSANLSFYDACRALSLIAVLISVVVILGYIVSWLLPDIAISSYSGEPYLSAALLFVSGGLMSAAAQVFQNNISDIFTIFDYGWSYFMAYGSAGYCFLSCAGIILAKKYCYDRCCKNSYRSI